jgi:uncharacterized protein with HEPN domain
MRRDELYLNDIIEAAGHVAEFLRETNFEGFRESELVRSAVVQKLTIIGEAAARISGDLRSRYPEIPWPQVVAFRNILVHAYFGTDWSEVWRTAKVDCPALRTKVLGILDAEFAGPAGESAC